MMGSGLYSGSRISVLEQVEYTNMWDLNMKIFIVLHVVLFWLETENSVCMLIA